MRLAVFRISVNVIYGIFGILSIKYFGLSSAIGVMFGVIMSHLICDKYEKKGE